MRMRFGQEEVAYDDAGSGPAVVLIHGFPLSRRMWHPQLAALASDPEVARVYLANASSTHHHLEVIEEEYRAMFGMGG